LEKEIKFIMAEVKILIEGYNFEESGEERTSPTMTLIKDKDIVMVVDPGVMEDQQILIDALNKEGLKINDVNFVCLTHSHIDHYRNTGMFPQATILEFYGLWHEDTVDDWEEQFTDDIKIIKTPGHDRTGITLLVKTSSGDIAICGDVFWKENFPTEDPYANNKEELEESRKKLLEIADYIIPGHAGMYKV
jgi:glyoxylase-like metal-dependent hydrolase (beta-lactamase superfamily II)